jgi:hypothetical protein
MRSEFRAPTGQMTAVRSEKVAGVRLIDGAIFDSKGIAVVVGSSIFDLNGRKLYDLKGTQVYKLSGELVGHILWTRAAPKDL